MPRQKEEYHKGDNVRIIDGPFLGFNGQVDDVDQERGRLKVLVSIFGRDARRTWVSAGGAIIAGKRPRPTGSAACLGGRGAGW